MLQKALVGRGLGRGGAGLYSHDASFVWSTACRLPWAAGSGIWWVATTSQERGYFLGRTWAMTVMGHACRFLFVVCVGCLLFSKLKFRIWQRKCRIWIWMIYLLDMAMAGNYIKQVWLWRQGLLWQAAAVLLLGVGACLGAISATRRVSLVE